MGAWTYNIHCYRNLGKDVEHDLVPISNNYTQLRTQILNLQSRFKKNYSQDFKKIKNCYEWARLLAHKLQTPSSQNILTKLLIWNKLLWSWRSRSLNLGYDQWKFSSGKVWQISLSHWPKNKTNKNSKVLRFSQGLDRVTDQLPRRISRYFPSEPAINGVPYPLEQMLAYPNQTHRSIPTHWHHGDSGGTTQPFACCESALRARRSDDSAPQSISHVRSRKKINRPRPHKLQQ